MRGKIAAVWALATSVAVGCRPAASPDSGSESTSDDTDPPPGAAVRQGAVNDDRYAAAVFDGLRAQYGDMTYADLAQRLALRSRPDGGLRFDPTRVAYYDKVRASLQLTPEEEAIYRRTGVIGVDHVQRYSMGSLYHAIYTQDLPVLVTTDSILYAMHRSFDAILMQLELAQFAPAMTKALESAHAALRAEMAAPHDARLTACLGDVDLYLTVARNLLAGAPSSPSVRPIGAQDDAVTALLGQIAAATPRDDVQVYGGRRPVDWSQFVPRGHYTKLPQLSAYFRAMMWLGRADLGFYLRPPAPAAGIRVDAAREATDAALLALTLSRAGQLAPIGAVSRAIDFLVGASDSVTPAEVASALALAGVKGVADLADPSVTDRATDRMLAELRKAGVGGQRIRSQRIESPREGTDETPLPDVLQLFGQRFVIDSFVLSKVVFDSIVFQGQKQEREMPSGLDVMAALGNDEAVSLLQPDLDAFHYSANLLAARTLVKQRPPESWRQSVYDVWLDALSRLDAVPDTGAFPQAMRGLAWQAKELQTQLGSWAELRHDTILYAKQSYTAMASCEYPTGYVEPYPEVFARVARFAAELKRRLDAGALTQQGVGEFLDRFAGTVRRLESLARKELAGREFTGDEKDFVKKTIEVHVEPGGCGGGFARYSGWYPTLLYGSPPAEWAPTIADVHTGPDGVLEEGVGDVNFLVVAIDNGGDRAAYVGPVYSYYEFTSPERLTDEAWQQRIGAGQLPERPAWTRSFRAKAVQRQLGR